MDSVGVRKDSFERALPIVLLIGFEEDLEIVIGELSEEGVKIELLEVFDGLGQLFVLLGKNPGVFEFFKDALFIGLQANKVESVREHGDLDFFIERRR